MSNYVKCNQNLQLSLQTRSKTALVNRECRNRSSNILLSNKVFEHMCCRKVECFKFFSIKQNQHCEKTKKHFPVLYEAFMHCDPWQNIWKWDIKHVYKIGVASAYTMFTLDYISSIPKNQKNNTFLVLNLISFIFDPLNLK